MNGEACWGEKKKGGSNLVEASGGLYHSRGRFTNEVKHLFRVKGRLLSVMRRVCRGDRESFPSSLTSPTVSPIDRLLLVVVLLPSASSQAERMFCDFILSPPVLHVEQI